MLMPIGKFKGQPMEDMATAYLFWLVSNDSIRFHRWPMVCDALEILRDRFADLKRLRGELYCTAPPPEYWKAKKPDRTAEKAEKLRQLTAKRVAQAQARAAAFHERRRLAMEQELRDRAAALQQLRSTDAYYLAKQKGGADVSDLL